MVFQLHIRRGLRAQALIATTLIATLLPASSPSARAENATSARYLRDAQALHNSGQFFKSARYAFAAQEADPTVSPEAYSWITVSLIRAGLYQSASYFFIRTLQSGNRTAIRRVLAHTQDLLVRVGADLMRKYLVRHTNYDDYDAANRGAYLYALGKDALIDGKEEKAIGYFNGMSRGSPLWPYALQLRASAYAIQGKNNQAIQDFESCVDRAEDYSSQLKSRDEGRASRANQRRRDEAEDLRSRCLAGWARTLYQMDRFHDADRVYDRIPKTSFVWTDILFEQAWASFARQEYNRSLGKLVTYKNPSLKFVFNTEADVLRAQSFLALCLYSEANEVINEFNRRYSQMGEEVKRFVERNSSNLYSFYNLGRSALRAPLHTDNVVYRLVNRFVRSPYFQNIAAAEVAIGKERVASQKFGAMQPGVDQEPGKGFPGFLGEVLNWRSQSNRQLGGAFVKNSLIDYHTVLVADFEKMAFIKLEMLSRAKDKLLKRRSSAERGWGNNEPSRRGDQYYWSFNGEFWADELGDYVFGLESECNQES